MTLYDIRDYLNSLSELFATLLDLELTILSNYPVTRISGTGFYGTIKANLTQEIWQRSYTYRVLESGKPLIVLDPSEYIKQMPLYEQEYYGKYYSILLYPIYHKSQLLGVIVLASFSEKQQNFLFAKKDQLMKFLELAAELIDYKLSQDEYQNNLEIMNKQLILVSENLDDGVVLCAKDKIIWLNTKAKTLLQIENPESYNDMLEKVSIFANKAASQKEKLENKIQYKRKKETITLIIRAIPLNDNKQHVMCLILPFSKIQDTILQRDKKFREDESNVIIAESKLMTKLLDDARKVANNDSDVLIRGESGTGKEIVARMIHSSSKRKNKPFVVLNCAAIPDTLLESELFGYEDGAFTGARKGGKIGKFMLADGGTLFLDEIGDMPLYLQAKLLRAIGEREVSRLGGDKDSQHVDVRLISATNKNLEEMINSGQFRSDLYYRINVVPLVIAPLRDRKEDIEPLIKYFLQKYNKKLNKDIQGLSNDALRVLLNYEWEGNVRQLQNCVEYMMNFSTGKILTKDTIPKNIVNAAISKYSMEVSHNMNNTMESIKPLRYMIAEYKRKIFIDFKNKHNGKPTLTEINDFCGRLEISRATYYREMSNSQK